MTDQTRRNIFRYGIAIDLAILATAVGMLLDAPTAALLIFIYAAAVALSVWKGGWTGGLTALLLSVVAIVAVFPAMATAGNLAALAGASLVESALIAWATRPLRTAAAPLPIEATTGPIAVPTPQPEALAEVVPFDEQPLIPAQQEPITGSNAKRSRGKKRAEAEAERLRLQQELEARVARERETAQRELQERVAAERRAIEEEVARQRAEAEAERQRLEAERRASEEEAARVRAEAEQRAAEAEAERVRLENERREIAERLEAEAAQARAAAEAERVRLENERREVEERLVAEAAQARAEAEAERARLEHERREVEERLAAERQAAEEEAARIRAEAERRAAEAEAERARLERERREIEERVEAARRAAEEEVTRQRGEAERRAVELELRVAHEREAAQREMQEQIAAERRAAEEDLRRQLDMERQAMRADVETELAAERERLAAERARIESAAAERIAAAHQAAEAAVIAQPPAPAAQPAPPPPPPPKASLVDTLTGWFRREERPRAVNLKTRRVSSNTMPKRTAPATAPRPAALSASQASKPRLLLIERRRATADTIAPKLKHRGVEIEVVERWVDAVDEIFRFRPHALFLDIEHPEFDRMHRTISEKATHLPIVLTGRSGSTPPAVKHSMFIGRPYDIEELTRLAQQAFSRPQDLLAEQAIPRAAPRLSTLTMVPTPSLRAPVMPKPVAAVQPASDFAVPGKPITDEEYEITCFACRAPFNAIEADWCSCLAKERTLVCTNCLSCFCKAPPSYKEKFWVSAPPRLFERKTTEARRQGASLPPNAHRAEVKRPLVLTVEDDEEIQAIVQRVCANLDYGFIWATNGQDGLDLAREYHPNMILSDAFMPKLDGREMCRMLKEEPAFAETRMVIMTGLYTDTKYRSEAVKRFHVDDYIAKPVAITDLINLLQKHLEGVTGLPLQEDLHELHRQQIDESQSEAVQSNDVPLSDLLLSASELVQVRSRPDAYDVCCFNCQATFDATHAEWCSCVGRDNTLLCPQCSLCFCKAPAAYRERFWIDAPPSLFERKMIGSKRNLGARSNPAPAEVKRPLILLVEDDENVQLIVRTVVSNMGYGFVVGADGQEGLTLAREYDPDMILSDAFMPKLDGREMCRLLKEDPNTSRSKAVIMTGLYTDRKYRNEALDYFKVDDYVAKPLAVDDLIKLFKKHLPQEVTTAH